MGIPIFPPTITDMPAAFNKSPTRDVTVVLPFDPVIPITFELTGLTSAKISISPITGMPRFRAV